ncbi:TonB family protein [Sphingomonas changnyeongensis]|uniref:TonB family protein n=1 Tax=Sphingomonas changnyeongensis TaxID=2698679 RepID=A0A7Z2NXJ3_9SPHN|nr:energy transducer TonB [Sphingomonas changnyeongensis]QHL91582.1 TonB family protein [Sphingomonas changnyeongensis]
MALDSAGIAAMPACAGADADGTGGGLFAWRGGADGRDHSPPPALPGWQRSAYAPRRGGSRSLLLAILALHGLAIAGVLAARAEIGRHSLPVMKTFDVRLAPPPPDAPPPPPATANLAPAATVQPAPATLVAPPALIAVPAPTLAAPPAAQPVPAAAPAAAPAGRPAMAEGGDLSATMVSAPPPRYPIESRRRCEQGAVLLAARLDTEGRVAALEIARSSGHDRLDRAALEAVRRWRWSPVMRDGVAVPVRGTVEIPFILSNAAGRC